MAEPGRAEPGRAEPGRAEPGRAEPGRAEPGRAEPGRAEPGRAEPERAKPERAKPGHTGSRGAEPGPDGRLRCPWGVSPPEYLAYHDEEWSRPVRGDRAIFERITLEAFQSGLSWLTILRKRENFRKAFAGFCIERVAKFGDADFQRLMSDAGIVRNKAKINAAITNARAALDLSGGLSDLVWRYADDDNSNKKPAPETLSDVPAFTEASRQLSKELRRNGFTFTGPVTAYATMQACGLVNDHLAECFVRAR